MNTRSGMTYIRETVFYDEDIPKAKMVKTTRVGMFDGKHENITEFKLFRYSQAHGVWLPMRPFDSEEEILDFVHDTWGA